MRFRIMVPGYTSLGGEGYVEVEHFDAKDEAELVTALQLRTPVWPPRAVLVPTDEAALTAVLRATLDRLEAR